MPASTPQARLQQLSNSITLQEKREVRRKEKMAAKGEHEKRHKVAVIGSGNWGSAIAKIVGENAREHEGLFDPEVKMWVFEEDYQLKEDHPSYDKCQHSKPQPLTKLINTLHENPKYLPGIRLPDNIVACPSLPDAVKDASILIFNVPHQFTSSICSQIDSHILPFARGISCIKGVDVSKTEINLFSSYISEKLNIYCGALSGANIADEVAREKFSETTIGYAPPEEGLTPVPAEYHPVDHALWKTLFHRPYFHVRCIDDVAGVSLGGALKNIIALGTGFVDGLGWGDNAKAAIMRVGLLEMRKFGKKYFSNCRTATFTEESCGVADLITSCNGGRNARCAKLAVQRGCSVEEVEEKELNGQKLQGTLTAREVNSFLKEKGDEAEFPLFTAIYQILKGEYRVEDLPDLIET